MLGEFEIIDRYFRKQIQRSDVVEGIGNDGAVLKPSPEEELVVTVDTLIEGVHFPSDTDPEAIGFKSLAVNLSDLAAMGAKPAWFTLSLSLPGADEDWLGRFSQGLFRIAERYSITLIGGDTTQGALSVTITAMGFVPTSQAMRRDGAHPGDAVYVTGSLGDAGLGLAALNNIRVMNDADRKYCLSRLNLPQPRVEAGLIIRDYASAAIDVSDGLVADLNHVLSTSRVGASIQMECIPLSNAFHHAFGTQPDWQIALTFGDDYELLFTVPESKIPLLQSRICDIDCKITRIGRIETLRGLRFTSADGREYRPEGTGYKHFRENPLG
jgi:thiamine-monophosphate kinase